jgi:prevent-host-death family protein
LASLGTAMNTICLREANQNFSGLVERVARTGQGVIVTQRGVPVVRILPIKSGDDAPTAEQQAVLDRLLGEKLPLAPWRFDRDELSDW